MILSYLSYWKYKYFSKYTYKSRDAEYVKSGSLEVQGWPYRHGHVHNEPIRGIGLSHHVEGGYIFLAVAVHLEGHSFRTDPTVYIRYLVHAVS